MNIADVSKSGCVPVSIYCLLLPLKTGVDMDRFEDWSGHNLVWKADLIFFRLVQLDK